MTMQKIAQRMLSFRARPCREPIGVAQTSNWSIDPAHSTAQFTVRHLGIRMSPELYESGGQRRAGREEHCAVAGISHHRRQLRRYPVEMRDKDLKSPNFFDVESIPHGI